MTVKNILYFKYLHSLNDNPSSAKNGIFLVTVVLYFTNHQNESYYTLILLG